jgi:hypothetical protein
MSVAFDNGTSHNWQIARRRIITSSTGVYEVTLIGDTSIAGFNNVVVWGTNRRGNIFYTQINQAVKWNTTCPAGPSSGVKVHKGIAREITVTFGVDQSGNPVTGSCPYGFKIGWQNLINQSRVAIISY